MPRANWTSTKLPRLHTAEFALSLALVAIQLGLFNLPSTVAAPSLHIIINEVEMDPPGTDPGRQWIEFYNPATVDFDISGWRVQTARGAFLTLSPGSTITREGYLILLMTAITLTKNGDSVTLVDRLGNQTDSTPLLRDVSNDNRTWQRFPNGFDTGSISDWRFGAATKGFTNGKLGAEITLNQPSIAPVYGQRVTLFGKINVTNRVQISLQIMSESLASNTTVLTMDDGTFSYDWQPDSAGKYTVIAFWNGDALHNQARSSPLSIIVDKARTTLSVFPAFLNLTGIKTTTFAGTLKPYVPLAVIVITVIAPNGSSHIDTTPVLQNGTFTYTFTPAAQGNWRLTTSWAGDPNHYGATAVATLTVLQDATQALSPTLAIPLILIPLSITLVLFVYKFGGSPIRQPIGKILKRRAPQHLRPLRVLNGAICPICFRPMTYEPKGADWHCEHCGVYYET